MHLKYYIIRGRGDDGLSFQLARIKDEQGNTYKGKYDMERQFKSIDELKAHLSEVVNVDENTLKISAMTL